MQLADDRPVRWGVWGTGHIAAKFATDLSAVPDAQLHSVCSRDLSKARAFAERFGNKPTAHSTETFLSDADADLDIIYIASPHIVHLEQAVKAMEHGKSVLIEKPVAMNKAEALAIEAASKKHKKLAMEALWTRFLPTTQKAREILRSGTLGRPLRADVTLHFRRRYDPRHRLFDPALGGGAMLDLGVYPLSVAQFLLGDLVLDDARWAAAPSGVDHNARFAFTAGRVPVDAAVGFWENRRLVGDNRFIVYCEKGIIALDRPFVAAPKLSIWHNRDKALPRIEGNRFSRAVAKLRNRPDESFAPARDTTGLNYQVDAVHRALRAGERQVADMPMTVSADVLGVIEDILARAPGAGPFR
ncbi:MAG: Gfo/Idh/MocA family oxidoreductase [Pseudomonadota bacterium]